MCPHGQRDTTKGGPMDRVKEAARLTMIRYMGKEISVSEAEALLGREEAMKALAYAAEHVVKAVFLPSGELIVFNALPYFLETGVSV